MIIIIFCVSYDWNTRRGKKIMHHHHDDCFVIKDDDDDAVMWCGHRMVYKKLDPLCVLCKKDLFVIIRQEKEIWRRERCAGDDDDQKIKGHNMTWSLKVWNHITIRHNVKMKMMINGFSCMIPFLLYPSSVNEYLPPPFFGEKKESSRCLMRDKSGGEREDVLLSWVKIWGISTFPSLMLCSPHLMHILTPLLTLLWVDVYSKKKCWSIKNVWNGPFL